MAKTRVVNVKHEECDVYIGRAMPGFSASIFRNRFRSGIDGTRSEVIAMFKADLLERLKNDPVLRAELEKLRGKRIGCWCKPRNCHGDILVEILEGLTVPEPPAQGSLF
jgi:hypothetical protein